MIVYSYLDELKILYGLDSTELGNLFLRKHWNYSAKEKEFRKEYFGGSDIEDSVKNNIKNHLFVVNCEDTMT